MSISTVYTAALSILYATGLQEKLDYHLFGDNGDSVAEKIIFIAQEVTQTTDLTTVIRVVHGDHGLLLDVKQALIDQLISSDKSEINQIYSFKPFHSE